MRKNRLVLALAMAGSMRRAALLVITALVCGSLYAQTVEVKDAWVRTSVQGQKATGAFMKIIAKEGVKLISVSTPVAGVAEVHEMKMEGDVMRMRALSGAQDLPAGETMEFKSGGYHIMLMDLRVALPKGSIVPLTLVFKDAKGVESKVALKVPVATVAPGSPATKAGAMPAMDHSAHKL
jgi:copper(I)-binding protein